MKNSSRRNFILSSIAATSGALLASGSTNAREQSASYQGGLLTGKPKVLPYKSIPGFLSEAQISPHYSAHYGGALKGYIAADEKLQSSITENKEINSSAFGAIQRARTNKANSVILHELYFEGMSAKTGMPDEETSVTIKKRFGSVENWAADFQACARAATGWAMLAYHPLNGKLYNVVSDKHASGVLWMATPLVVIDVYEHAFYVDYQNNKNLYIEKFMEHINWNQTNIRVARIS